MKHTRIGSLIMAGGCLLLVGSLGSQRVAQGQTQNEMNRMTANDIPQADKDLNTVYRRLLNKTTDPVTVKKLKIAERAWIVYREAEANYEASKDAEGGTMYSILYASARVELTQERTKHLQEVSNE